MPLVSRRTLLQSGLLGAAALSFGPGFWRDALAATPARPGPGPYGPLRAPDANGIRLPEGFTSRVIARAGVPVRNTPYTFPIFPDGQATFSTPDGGWILVTNSEVPSTGGASAIRFAPDATITDAYRILDGTDVNCAGGPTPWGTWLSCEEVDDGQVWECDPTGARAAVVRPALGTFKHEAVCVDPDGRLYLSEDLGDGGLYRFTPTAYPDLAAGLLEVACGTGPQVSWKAVPDPLARDTPTRSQVPDIRRFARGEGIWFDSGTVYLATTADETVHAYDTATETIEVLYRADDAGDTPLRGVDNLHVSRSGDLFVAEDSYENDPDAMDVCIITPEREVSRFLKLTGSEHFLPGPAQSETVGLTFDPSGTRLYFGSQRAFGTGVVYEVTGPFRGPRAPAVPTLGLAVARRIGLRRFTARGIPVALTLDEAAPVHLALTARVTVGGRRRKVTLARLSRKRVGRGPETLRLRPTAAGRRVLKARRHGIGATLEAQIADRTLRRPVRLILK